MYADSVLEIYLSRWFFLFSLAPIQRRMSKIKWLIYGIVAIHFIGTFAYTLHEHYIQLNQYDGLGIENLNLDYVLLKVTTGYFIAIPFLILGVFGLIYRRFAGWIFLLLYPFLLLIYKLCFGFSWTGIGDEYMEILIPLFIIILVNIPEFRQLYDVEKQKKVLLGNITAITAGILLCSWIVIHYEVRT